MENQVTYNEMIEVFNNTDDTLKRKEALVDFIKTKRKKTNYDKEIRKRKTDQ